MIVLLLLALIIPAVLLRAWAISWLWLWFVVPLGVPAVGMAWAVGISSFMALFTTTATSVKGEEPMDAIAKTAGQIFAAPLVAVGVGWVAHLAMAS